MPRDEATPHGAVVETAHKVAETPARQTIHDHRGLRVASTSDHEPSARETSGAVVTDQGLTPRSSERTLPWGQEFEMASGKKKKDDKTPERCPKTNKFTSYATRRTQDVQCSLDKGHEGKCLYVTR
jgi:hypothetical protein